MYFTHKNLLLNPKKVCHGHFNAHKLQKIVNMNENNKTENWDFRFRFRSLVSSASLLREYATPTLTTTSRPNLWWLQFLCYIQNFN